MDLLKVEYIFSRIVFSCLIINMVYCKVFCCFFLWLYDCLGVVYYSDIDFDYIL